MELHPVFVNGFEGFSYPAKTDLYSDGQYKIWRNISSRVDIPKTFFKGVKGETELSILKISLTVNQTETQEILFIALLYSNLNISLLSSGVILRNNSQKM